MTDYYILDGKTPVPCPDMITWSQSFKIEDRRVALDDVGKRLVSTVFLGIDHRFLGDGPPLLFETMTFGADGHDEDIERTSTWEEAEAAHARAIAKVKERVDVRLP